ncbi:MAG: hypothetical protein Q8P83_03585 [bacterium]|nr:hypothetical protein [bacterium]
MQIQERRVGDVVILDLKGSMTLGEGDEDVAVPVSRTESEDDHD